MMNFLKKAIKTLCDNLFSKILFSLNFGFLIWIFFFKARLPANDYDYSDEPAYFKIFRAVNVIPESFTGLLFYPIDHLFVLDRHPQWQGAIFYLIFFICTSLQWTLIGSVLAYLLTLQTRETSND